jgi:hypothetical protein
MRRSPILPTGGDSSSGSDSLLSLVHRALTEKWVEGPQIDELHKYIWETLGINIPRVACCPGHQAPFDFVVDAYFEKVANQLVHACRSGGKTKDTAVLNVLDAGFHNASVVTVAGSKFQAKQGYEYSKDLWFMDPALKGKLLGEPLMSETRLKSGAKYEILAASPKSVRSPHVPKLRMDEIEEMAPEVFKGALSIPASKPGISTQVLMTSTWHKAVGPMQTMLDEAEARGFKVYTWCVWETMQRCERDCSTCPMEPDCQGKAKKADGYRPYEEILQQFLIHDRDTWESEHLCLVPSKKKRVYAQFDRAVHLIDADQVPEGLKLWGCIDWGYDNPFVFAVLGLAGDDRKFILEENYERHQTDDELAALMWERYGGKITDVCCDPSSPGGAKSFRKVGFRVHRNASRVKDGIDEIRKDLKPAKGPPRLYFVKGQTTRLVQDFEGYENREGTDEPKKTQGYDHGCFVAGTVVETKRGSVPIETIRVNDSVLTRAGYRPVLDSAMTNYAADVFRVLLSDGRMLTGTGNHPVFVEGKGFVALGALRYGDSTAGLITKPELARTAGSRSLSTNTTSRSAAPVHVLSVSAEQRKRPVYNLTVEGQPEYFANGILVHNCDAVRYWYANNRQGESKAAHG